MGDITELFLCLTMPGIDDYKTIDCINRQTKKQATKYAVTSLVLILNSSDYCEDPPAEFQGKGTSQPTLVYVVIIN